MTDLVGFFVNTWVLRVAVDSAVSFTRILAQVKQKALAAYANQDAPFELLVELLNPVRSPAHHPLFQVMLAFQNNESANLSFPDADLSWIPVSTGTSRMDLFFNIADASSVDAELGSGWGGLVEYATDLFDLGTVETLVARFVRVLDQVVADPDGCVGSIDLLDETERQLVLKAWNDTAVPVPHTTIPELFARQVERVPDAVAVVCGDRSLTYAELDRESNRLARVLISRGVGPETVVAVALPRSADLIVALLGVLKAGGAYLPIDPGYPSDRLEFMLTDAAPLVIITDQVTAQSLPDTATPRLVIDQRVGALDPVAESLTDSENRCRPHPDNLAYLIYTSGSTGTPKGVAITHRNVASNVGAVAAILGEDGLSRVLASTSTAFDVSVFEIFATLCLGGIVELVRDVLVLSEQDGWSGSVVSTVPSAFVEVLDNVRTPINADTVVYIGEALTSAVIARTRALNPDARVVNGYGPTEATVFVTAFAVGAGDEVVGDVPIGSPLANVQVYVLGAALEPVPVGVVGELYVGVFRLVGVSRSGGVDGVAVCGRSVRAGGVSVVSHGGSGAVDRIGGAGVRRAGR
ncbi:hxxPF-repeated domain protein [Rhodococcus sp. MTM3W5.2]|uniref:non-ribosomal peptide synthetase n=1 Tax=Rhodococcus sp. MTM3W5.2 TaxID=1805827 RepID=UPI000979180F|nr:AMP-binding protein [Rhodococcus sp. MTM3W5.2]AQA22412.1 hxxPF-repeated domain protein [Rhodococcus sp. MTM3W5.2]